ncbi:MAG: AAA family ATPase [Firmicutes bacterium]|nr:AAA family ATPase [Bacillota bacterium]
MVIDKIEVEGYGKLTNTSVSFTKSFNVLCGTNESGKTTLLRGLIASLYGQEDEDGLLEKEEMAPWDAYKYAVTTSLTFKNGNRVRISRDFSSDSVNIIELRSDGTRAEHKNAQSIKKALGLSKDEFLSCAIITNDQISNPDEKDILSSILTTIVLSDEGNKTCRNALNKLETILRETSPAPASQGGSAPAGSVEKLEADRQKFIKQVKTLEDDTKTLLYKIRREEYIKCQTAIEQVQKLEKEIKSLRDSIAGVDDNTITVEGRASLYTLSSELNTAKQRLEEMDTRRQDMMNRYGEVREKIRSKERFLERGEEKLDILEHALTTGGSKEAVIESKRKMLEESRKKLTEIKSQHQHEAKKFIGFNTPEEFDEKVSDLENKLNRREVQRIKEDEIDRLREDQQKYRTRIRQNFITSIFAMVAGGGLIFLGIFTDIFIGNFEVATRDPIRIAAGLGLIVVGFLMWYSTKSIRQDMSANMEMINSRIMEIKRVKDDVASAQIGMKELFARVGALSADELRKKYREFNRIVIDLETTVNLVKTLENEINNPTGDTIESPDARKLLMDMGLLKKDEILEKYHIQRFREEYDHARKLVEKSETMKAEYENFLTQRKQLNDKVVKLEEKINEILAMGEVDTREEYDEQYRLAQEVGKIKTKIASLEDKRNYLLDGEKYEFLVEKEVKLRKAVESYLGQYPELSKLPFTGEKLEQLRDKLDETRQNSNNIQMQLSGLETEIERVRSLPSTSGGSAQFTLSDKKGNYNENQKQAIEAARKEIEHICSQYGEQILFPALEGFMADILKKITGKYDQVHIGKDMEIMVKPSNSDKLAKIGSLSRSAREQVYFALRIGIIRLMSMQSRFIPIILDDPFMQFDEERRMKVFEILLEMSRRHQTILMISSRYQKREFENILTERNQAYAIDSINHFELIKPSA